MENQYRPQFAQAQMLNYLPLRRGDPLTKTTNQTLTPEEWIAATDYALTLSEKMIRASEQRSEENKAQQQKRAGPAEK